METDRRRLSTTARDGLAAFVPAALLALLVLMVATPSALAETTFCPPGSGAAQCEGAKGVATDFTAEGGEGRVYVADTGNHRVNVFRAEDAEFLFAFGWGVDTGAEELQTCTTASGCQKGLSGPGPGQLSSPRYIAVDNDEASPSHHSVYVFASGRVVKYGEEGELLDEYGLGSFNTVKGLATIEGGTVYVADDKKEGPCEIPGAGGSEVLKRVLKFDHEGEEIETVVPDTAPCGQVEAFGARAGGDFVLGNQGGTRELREYDPTGAEQCAADPLIETRSLGIDEAGRLFAAQREPGVPQASRGVITEYGGECDGEALPIERRFGYGKIAQTVEGVATFVGGALGDVLAAEPGFGSQIPNGIHYLDIPPLGPIVVPGTVTAQSKSVRADIEALINPEGETTTYRVDWVDLESFETEGGFESPNKEEGESFVLEETVGPFRANPAEAVAGCLSFEEGGCLEPETTYRYRVVATNDDNETEEGLGVLDGGQLTTLGPLEIVATFPSDPAPDAIRLNATVNPLGSAASGYFEYVDEAAYQEDLDEGGDGFAAAKELPAVSEGAAPLDFGASEEPTRRGATLGPLPEGAAYRFRVVVSNDFATETGPPRAFATLRAVQPTTGCANDAFRSGVGAYLPDCRAFELVSPLDKANGDIVLKGLSQSALSGERLGYGATRAFGDAKAAPFVSQYLARRTAAGWQGRGITPGLGKSILGAAKFEAEYRSFSADLCQGWTAPLYDPDPALVAGAEEGHRNLYRRTDQLCAGAGLPEWELLTIGAPSKMEKEFQLEPQGHSADGRITAFAAIDSLAGTAAPVQPSKCEDGEPLECELRVYVAEAGDAPVYACVLPGGAPSGEPCSAGTNSSRPAFGIPGIATLTGALSEDGSRLYWTEASEEGRIYVRENPLGTGTECAGASSPCTRHVSKAGEEESGTLNASRFWAAAADGSRAYYSTGGDLYLYEFGTGESTPVAQGFVGVAAASEDATRLYFASTEVIAGSGENSEGDEAQAGEPNLYLYETGEGGSFRFVATLADADADVGLNFSNHSSVLAAQPRRHNARATPSGDVLAFMSQAPLTGFDNTDAQSPVPCGSEGSICDNEVFLYDAEAEELLCASCNPSGSRPEGTNVANSPPFWVAARLPAPATSLHAPRVLSSDGSRLFFESSDPLVSRDTNGRLDVYQWELPGSGGCTAADPSFVPSSGGCVALVSTGQSERDSELVDADADGSDVFFTTVQSLWGPDPGAQDIYDARAGGGIPAPPAPAPECEGESCQGPPAAPEAPAPASATYSGPGDLAGVPTGANRCNRSARRAKGLAGKAKRLRRAARRAAAPAGKRKRMRAARRSARQARRLSRNAKRCRARARAQRRSQR